MHTMMKRRSPVGLAFLTAGLLALGGCEAATDPTATDAERIGDESRLQAETPATSIVPAGTVYRIYRPVASDGSLQGPFGLDRDVASLEALGLVQGTDFFLHPVGDIASGIPAGTDVVIVPFHNQNSVAINTLLDIVGDDNPSTPADERTTTDIFNPLLAFLFQGGTVYVNMAGQNAGLTYRPPATLYNAPVPAFPPDAPKTDASLTGATFSVPGIGLVSGAAGADGALGTADDHPFVLGPDGRPGTSDDLDDLLIDVTTRDVALGNLSDGVSLPLPAASTLTVLATAVFGGNARPILAEYCWLNGLVVVTRMSMGEEAQQPAGPGASFVQRNIYAHAGAAARAQLCGDNDPPTAEPNGPYVGTVGNAVSFSGSGADPDGGTLTFEWDFGDGSPLASGANPTHTYASAGTFQVTLTVTDDEGAASSATTTATIEEPIVTNEPPTADPGGPYAANEGEALTFDGSGSSDPEDGALSFDWNFGDGQTADNAGSSPTHTYAEDGSYTVTLTVTDPDGAQGTAETTATIANVAPAVDGGAGATLNEGQTFTGSGSFTDPGADDWTATVDYGAGAGPVPLPLDGTTFELQNTYLDNPVGGGAFDVTVTVSDDDGGSDSDVVPVTVLNIAPTVDAGPDVSIVSGQSFDLSAEFSDVGVEDAPWSFTVDWGTGDPQATGQSTDQSAPIALTSPHFFLPGTYAVTVTVTDKDDGVGSDELTVEVRPFPVNIDIKPGSDPNSVNVKDGSGGGNGKGKGKSKGKGKGKGKSNSSNAKIPVALLGAPDFDVTAADIGSIVLGDGSGPDTPVAVKPNGRPFASFEDVNADGFMDLVLHFERSALIGNGDLTGSSTSLTLRGTLASGVVFEGADSVNPVP